MNEQPSGGEEASTKKLSSTDKGKIVERIVALMHKYPDTGVKVEQNVRLPPVHNRAGRKREIDVLLTRDVAGHPVQIAIECKNYQRRVDTPAIEAFVTKLRHIGIPYGMYVSASGYTEEAIESAALDGIKTFTLKDLTEEVLYASVVEAFESVVYLFCQVVIVYVTTPFETYKLLQAPFYDKNGKQCGTLGDLAWQRWMSEERPLSLGGHELALELPSHWNFVVGGHIVPVTSVNALVDVSGLFGGRIGQATGSFHSLIKASDNTVDRNLLKVEIDVSQSDYAQAWVHSEDELQRLLERAEKVCIHNRIRLPRIIVGGIYWPPSVRVQERVNELMRAFESGEIADPRPFSFQELEGSSIHTAFEPIWEGYRRDWV